ncbi:MAG TPA: hypothetical protein VFO83_08015 [Aggregicoccus sp.]|nr:hypothetical protein [Aggregicoccus sp.]
MRWVAVAAVLGTASVAAAQSEEPAIEQVPEKVDEKVAEVKAGGGAGNFGQVDQLVLANDFDMRLGYRDTDEKFYIRLAPAADYFFQENLSLGAAVQLGTTIGEGPEVTTLGALVRAGYNMPFQETLSLWPKLGFGIFHQNSSTQLAPDTTSFQIQLSAPVVFHPANHFFVGAGPNLDIFLGDGSGFDIGIRTVVGGYF